MPEFNPYREWLGIESKSQPTYYQLLGISLSESDPETIKRHAKGQLRRLRAAHVGEHSDLRDDIIHRIKRATKCLLDEDLRSEYDRRLHQLIHQTLIQPREPVDRGDIPKPTSPSASVDFPSKATPSPQSGEVIAGGRRASRRSIARGLKQHHKRFRAVTMCILLATVSLLGIGYLLGTQTNLLTATMGSAQNNRVKPVPNATPSNREDAEPVQQPIHASSPSKGPSAVTTSRSNYETSKPQGVVESVDEPSVPVSTENLAELGRLLTETRAALTERKIDKARNCLASASVLITRPRDEAKYKRLAKLTDYVEQYWKAASHGLGQVQAGEELTIKGTRVMVVEKNDETLILRVKGQNKTYSLRNLPLTLQMFFAERWFDPSAGSTKLFRGAMMAVSADFDEDEVRQLWRTAQLSGEVDLGDLELVLDDTYDFVP